jgi:hypothetical protein
MPVTLPDLTGTVATIGRDRTSYYWNGYIDEVRIYSTALTSAEIQQHYAMGLLRHLLAKN